MISALSVGLAAITGVIIPTPTHLVTATHLKTGHPYKKSTGTRSLNGLQFLAADRVPGKLLKQWPLDDTRYICNTNHTEWEISKYFIIWYFMKMACVPV